MWSDIDLKMGRMRAQSASRSADAIYERYDRDLEDIFAI
ncbi:MAG: hypothetical protein ACO3I5_05735 [Pontimonas sp.]